MNDFAALGIAINPSGPAEQRVSCPWCGPKYARGGRDDAMGINIQSGTYHCFRCGAKGRAGTDCGEPRPIVRINDPSIPERKRERLRSTWRETVPLDHKQAHAVCAYLRSRALGEVLRDAPRVLRAHPALEYWDGSRMLGRYPAMVALFHDAAGAPITLHCTYLRPDGCAKASVPSPKKILGVALRGATKGGAIHLYEQQAGILGVAEGIESALSLYLIQKVPTWASFCADNLVRVQLPHNLRELHIGVDLDESGKGEQVAVSLAKRVHQRSPHIRIFIVRPELDGFGDLNDELLHRGVR